MIWSRVYPECINVEEIPEHVVFACLRFAAMHRDMRGLTLDNIVNEEDTRKAVTGMLPCCKG